MIILGVRLPHTGYDAVMKHLLGLTCQVGSVVKNPPTSAGDVASIPGLGRSLGAGNGNPLQSSCLENPHGQRSLVGYSPWGCKELDMTEQLSTAHDFRGGTKGP